MVVEIFGAKFINKGAEMMLYSVIHKIKEEYPDAKFVLSCSSKNEFKTLTEKKFYKNLVYRKHFFDTGDFLGKLIPKSIRSKNNIVLEKEIDVFIEASGFAYGDQWTHRLSRYTATKIERMRRNGTKIIIMPQAMGPFLKSKNRSTTKRLLNSSNLVFIRDKQSFDYCKELEIKHSNLFLTPDFTMLLKPKYEDKYSKYKEYICIVPNNKVISTSKSSDTKNKYISLLSGLIKYYHSKNENVFILNHEGIKDYELAKEINDSLSNKVDIVWEKDIYSLKGLIGNSKILVGSRFHSLVSGLSQGIPSLAIGWSHKYEMLFDDFDCMENIIKLTDDKDEILKFVAEFSKEDNLASLQKTLHIQSSEQKQKINLMWEKIFKILKS